MKIFTQYRTLFWYGLLSLGFVSVILIEGQFFMGKYTELTQKESSLNESLAILKARKETLSSLSPEVLAASKHITSVLPSENAVLPATSQIRLSAIENKVTLKNLTTGTVKDATDPTLGLTQIGAIAEGDIVSVMGFLVSITKLAPIITLDSVNMITNPTNTVAQLNLLSFWSALPTKLPSITEPVKQLTDEEMALLEKINGYTEPIVTADFQNTDSSASGFVANTAPFSKVN